MGTLLDITTTRIRMADGKFDSLYRYIRAGTATGNFPICKGVTFDVGNPDINNYPSWRYSCGSGIYAMGFTALTGASPLTFNPSYVLVKL